MAFSHARIHALEAVGGDIRFTFGTFTNAGGSTGGDIYTGLSQVLGMILIHNAAAVVAEQPVLNETFPMHDPVTIVTTANASGYWMAWGS